MQLPFICESSLFEILPESVSRWTSCVQWVPASLNWNVFAFVCVFHLVNAVVFSTAFTFKWCAGVKPFRINRLDVFLDIDAFDAVCGVYACVGRSEMSGFCRLQKEETFVSNQLQSTWSWTAWTRSNTHSQCSMERVCGIIYIRSIITDKNNNVWCDKVQAHHVSVAFVTVVAWPMLVLIFASSVVSNERHLNALWP